MWRTTISKPGRFGRSCAVALVLAAAACHRAPEREIGQARQALASAKSAQADLFAPSSYRDARKALDDAERLVDKHEYADARMLALDSASKSRAALRLTEDNKRKMLLALRLALDSTSRDLQDAQSEIEVARAQGVDEKEITLFRTDLVGAQSRLEKARELVAAQSLPEARKWVSDAQDAAGLLLREIRYAIAQHPIAPPRKRGPRGR
jgi:hypothetical protein